MVQKVVSTHFTARKAFNEAMRRNKDIQTSTLKSSGWKRLDYVDRKRKGGFLIKRYEVVQRSV